MAGNLAATDLQAAAIELEKGVKSGLPKKSSKEKLDQSLDKLKKTLQAAIKTVRSLRSSVPAKPDQPSAAALVNIPPELARQAADQIREAADLGDVTRIKTIAEEFKSKSEAFAPIADRIIDLASDFDFDGMLKIAEQLAD